jgi:para-aminobenzoate synthetase component 1
VIVWDLSQGSIAFEIDAADHPLVEDADFHCLFERVLDDPFAVLLDSAASASRLSRRSIIAIEPEAVLVARSSPLLAAGHAQLELYAWDHDRSEPAHVQRYEGAPFAELERMLAERQLPPELRAQLPAGLIGGAIGFVGYDAGRFLEHLPTRAARDLELPELCFLFVDTLLVYEHESRVLRWVTSARGTDRDEAQTRCAERMRRLRARFASAGSTVGSADAPHAAPALQRSSEIGELHAEIDPDAYAEMVRAAKAQIMAGNVFEVCTSQRLEAAFPRDRRATWHLYRALRARSPAPFACCVLTPFACLLSSSPERFLQLAEDGWAESRPIKGTRPRGQDAADDQRLHDDLVSSEKDRAENVMIVDLVRNDLGRVCAVDSIHVPELMVVEQHPSVFQMVSTVRGRIEHGVSPVQLFTACFPPGSMTGAPKIEAMKVIDALEPVRRGIYAGAVGYFDMGGALDFSVVIRSFVITEGRCTLNVGGAVVADSDPEAEYLESMAKARALLAALEDERGRAR